MASVHLTAWGKHTLRVVSMEGSYWLLGIRKWEQPEGMFARDARLCIVLHWPHPWVSLWGEWKLKRKRKIPDEQMTFWDTCDYLRCCAKKLVYLLSALLSVEIFLNKHPESPPSVTFLTLANPPSMCIFFTHRLADLCCSMFAFSLTKAQIPHPHFCGIINTMHRLPWGSTELNLLRFKDIMLPGACMFPWYKMKF